MTGFRNIAEAHRRQAERLGPQVAVRYKRSGKFQDLIWSDYRTNVLACAAALGGRGHEQPAGARVVHLEVDLAGAERGVRRDGDAPGRQDAEVGDHPLDPVLAQEADAVAGLDAGRGQGRRARQDVGAVGRPCQVLPGPAPLIADGDSLAEPFRLPAVGLGDVAAIVHRPALHGFMVPQTGASQSRLACSDNSRSIASVMVAGMGADRRTVMST